MNNKDKNRIKDILDSIETISFYLNNMNLDAFMQDKKTQDAVLRRITIIGEAANHINIQDILLYTEWKDIIAMRNIIVHDYNKIDLFIVWETCEDKLPELKNFLQKTLSNNNS